MKKKITATILVVVLLAVAAVGGTLAYFTDTEEATNVFAIGNVDIELVELMASSEGYTAWQEQTLAPGNDGMNKLVLIKNTGKNDAYVRVKLTMDASYAPYLSIEGSNLSDSNFAVVRSVEEIDGSEYSVITINTVNPVKAGCYYGNSGSALLASDANPADGTITDYTFIESAVLQPTFQWTQLFGVPAIYCQIDGVEHYTLVDENLTFDVKVTAEAIQAEGFASYTEAFVAFEEQTTPSM